MRLDHVGVMTKDIEKSIAFYEDICGMTLKQKVTQNDGKRVLAFLGFQDGPETELELIEHKDDFIIEGKVNHVAIAVESVEDTFAHCQKKNASFIEEEIKTLSNGYRLFFIDGPEGEKVEFFER
ncbi:VOC family protein [Alkalicoccobacillus porphyridii]|uniref:VOC family protein n=1 Tax=Alkalicoccobacillus porphyridii TaxID=2597270 RepID=A0A554A296_9BACI|nr:VOC family protein [Alkalicoccobacillus porphyridii]TSB47808.1 VOC family protein [Alkalicoccobacillus porphyridii]